MSPDKTMLHGAWKAKEEGPVHFSPVWAQGHFRSGPTGQVSGIVQAAPHFVCH